MGPDLSTATHQALFGVFRAPHAEDQADDTGSPQRAAPLPRYVRTCLHGQYHPPHHPKPQIPERSDPVNLSCDDPVIREERQEQAIPEGDEEDPPSGLDHLLRHELQDWVEWIEGAR